MTKSLREYRVEQMLTLRDLADASGVSAATVLVLERGTRKPHFGTMLAIAAALDVRVRDIAEFDAALDAKAVAA